MKKKKYSYYRCSDCGLIFISPLPEDCEIKSVYSENYYVGAEKGFGYVDYEENKKVSYDLFNRYLEEIEKLTKKKGRLLDVGTATGSFLETAKLKGWEAEGVEISDYAVKKAQQKGLNVHAGTLESVNFQPAVFDVLTFWDSFEHLKDLNSTMEIVCEILREGGYIALNTPDSGSIFAKLSGKFWYHLNPPEHIHIFNLKAISLLFEKYNIKIVFVRRICKKFTMKYIFRILANWKKAFFLEETAEFFKKSCLGNIEISLTLWDNFFIVGMKTDK